jgi:multidrug efflux system outer membrane protein
MIAPRLSALAMAALLTGCAVGPDYKRPAVALPEAFAGTASAAGGQAPLEHLSADWWTLYNDETLNGLVEAALHNNVDLQRATAQIEEAQAVLDQAGSALFPTIDLNAASSRSRISGLNAQPIFAGQPQISTNHRLTLSTAFELDFWGKLRRASESARANLLSTRYGRDVVALSLAATVSQAYFTLRSLDAQISVSKDTLEIRDENLNMVKNRSAGGLATDLELSQAEASRADAALQLREQQRQRTLVEHQLAVLTSKLDLTLAPGDLDHLPLPAPPPVGLPSSLLERRPDVQQAEEALIAANADIGVARANQFPTFSLTGEFGGSSKDLSDILKAGARVWSVGLTGLLPVFDAGRLSAATRRAVAVRDEAVASYQKSVQTAFQDVSDALSNVTLTREAEQDVQIKLKAARNALRLSEIRYKAGYSPYLEVLDAQRTANDAALQLVQNRQAQLAYSVDLMKALGGGWLTAERGATPAASPQP